MLVQGTAIRMLILAGTLAAAGSGGNTVTRLTSLDGHPIRGADGGVIYRCSTPGDCEPTGGRMLPLAGRISSTVQLEVAIDGSANGSEVAPFSCSWKIPRTALGDDATLHGSRGTIEIRIPEKTGNYDLIVTCSMGARNAPETFTGPLFATFGELLPAVKARRPPADQYRKATRWAAGFGSDAEADAILAALMRGIYAYGQKHWRYGYCQVQDDGGCIFPGDPKSDPSSSQLDCGLVTYEPGDPRGAGSKLCKCTWQELLDDESGCQFGDCYAFSDVLYNLAGIQGIGGMCEIQITGTYELGFSTLRSARSLDPRFPGNLLCGESAAPCQYLFSSHALVSRDRIFYDTTFDRIYEEPDGAIDKDVRNSLGRVVQFAGGPTQACFRRTGYGTWPFYSAASLLLPDSCPIDRRQPVAFAEATVFRSLDLDADGIFEAIVADLDVEIREAGRYELQGGLFRDDQPISGRPTSRIEIPTIEIFTGEPGRRRATLIFSGEAVRRSGTDGPYELHAHLFSAEGLSDSLTATTPAFDHREFGELKAELEGEIAAVGVDPDTVGKFASLRATFPLTVLEAGTILVDARLASRGRTIANAAIQRQLSPGRHTVAVDFPGWRIARQGIDGVYEVTIGLVEESGVTPLACQTREIGERRAVNFAPEEPSQ